MAKKINSFKNMCQDDQVALLKGGCTEMMILRSIMQYDIDHSTWKILHSHDSMASIKTDLLKLANNNVYEEYENFIRSFDAKLRKDENVILIMSAIVLFTPNRPMTVHSDVLKLEQVGTIKKTIFFLKFKLILLEFVFILSMFQLRSIFNLLFCVLFLVLYYRIPTIIYCDVIWKACTRAVKLNHYI